MNLTRLLDDSRERKRRVAILMCAVARECAALPDYDVSTPALDQKAADIRETVTQLCEELESWKNRLFRELVSSRWGTAVKPRVLYAGPDDPGVPEGFPEGNLDVVGRGKFNADWRAYPGHVLIRVDAHNAEDFWLEVRISLHDLTTMLAAAQARG